MWGIFKNGMQKVKPGLCPGLQKCFLETVELGVVGSDELGDRRVGAG